MYVSLFMWLINYSARAPVLSLWQVVLDAGRVEILKSVSFLFLFLHTLWWAGDFWDLSCNDWLNPLHYPPPQYVPWESVCRLSFHSLFPTSHGVISLAWDIDRLGNHFIPSNSRPSVNGKLVVCRLTGTMPSSLPASRKQHIVIPKQKHKGSRLKGKHKGSKWKGN